MNSFPTAKIVDWGVDWLTLVTRDTNRSAEWKQIFADIASEEQQRGHKWSTARFFGYAGEQCGHIMYGSRQDGALVKLTSALAHEKGMLFSPDAVHCTRIDLQVTAELTYPRPDFINRSYENVVLHKTSNGRPPAAAHLRGSDGGQTLYVGSRSSMRYFRLYDKGVETGTDVPGKLLRWELEVKDVLADQAVAMLAGSADALRSTLGVVGSFCSDRGVPVLWTIPPLEEKFQIPRIAQEDAGSLRWLQGPVASVVARLMETVGAEQTIGALFSKWRGGSTDGDILGLMVEVAQSYADSPPSSVK